MKQYDLVIVGGGGYALLSGISALKNGIKDVMILEREDSLGGNLNLFINDGFGQFYFKKNLTGPEVASLLIEEYLQLGGKFKVDTNVLNIFEDKEVQYVNPTEGLSKIMAKSIILATGCREKYTGNIVVPVEKYTGIFTIASAHRMINFSGYLPGKEVVILGNDIWTFILARRLLIEGATIKAIVTNHEVVEDACLDIIKEFNIPIIYNSIIIEVGGGERINHLTIINNDKGESMVIDCDSLILSIGYYPEIEYLKNININTKDGFLAVKNYETSIGDIFCVGTIIKGIDGLFDSGEEAIEVGKIVADRVKNI